MTKTKRAGANISAAASTRRYIENGIRHVCETYRERLPGSRAERDAQAYFKGELEGYADEVLMEDFTLHPRAFMGFFNIAAGGMLLATPLYFLSRGSVPLAAAGLALNIVTVLVFLFEYLFYWEFTDFLYPKKTSRNVYAVRRPSGEVRRRIIFGGHTDAANEWTYSWLAEGAGVAAAIGSAVLAMIISLLAATCNVVYTVAANAYGYTAFASKWQGGWLAWSVLLLICVVPGVAIIFFINYRVVVDGANDNLSANYIAMSVLKEMREGGVRFGNTEVGCLITGSEEAGLRGAKAFAKKHRAMLEDPDVETIFVALDTMREIEELRVCNFGCTGTVFNDYAVGDLLRDAGRACGVEMPNSELYPGALDSEAFSVAGLRATGLSGVSHAAKRYYHTREDTADNIDMDCIALSLNICKEMARMFDRDGMAGYDEKRNKK